MLLWDTSLHLGFSYFCPVLSPPLDKGIWKEKRKGLYFTLYAWIWNSILCSL